MTYALSPNSRRVGFSISDNGTVAYDGMPMDIGQFRVLVQATNGSGQRIQKTISVEVEKAAAGYDGQEHRS